MFHSRRDVLKTLGITVAAVAALGATSARLHVGERSGVLSFKVGTMFATCTLLRVEPRERGAVRMLLADEGYASITAPDVLHAIAAIERDDPGLVLLDWSLDDGSGEAVLSAARQRVAAHTPVVLMTGSSSLNARSKAADAILKKPFDVGELLRVVARFYRP